MGFLKKIKAKLEMECMSNSESDTNTQTYNYNYIPTQKLTKWCNQGTKDAIRHHHGKYTQHPGIVDAILEIPGC